MNILGYFCLIWMLFAFVSHVKPDEEKSDLAHYDTPLDERQLGPIGLTILGALTLPLLIPVGVARLVSRLSNLGNNSAAAIGVTVRPVILPGRPNRRPLFGKRRK